MNVLEAIDDPNLLGASIRDAESWEPWKGLLAAAFGLELSGRTSWLFIASVRARLCRLARLQATFGW